MPSEALQTIIELMRAWSAGRDDRTYAEQRADLDAMAGGAPLPDGTRCTPIVAGGVACEWVAAPDAADERAVVYLHGGGYCTGSLASHRSHAARVSAVTGASVLTVDYRLAPEHPHPAAVDDAVAAYHWLLDAGLAPRRLVFAGDSAGGGLSVAALVALRDRGTALPAGAVCISPWTDLALSGDSVAKKAAVDPMCRRDSLARMAEAYLAGADPRTPLASPIHADLRGLPPLLVHVGTDEILLDDAVRLAARAREADVDVALEPWDGMIHVWHLFAPMLPEAEAALGRVGDWVRARLA